MAGRDATNGTVERQTQAGDLYKATVDCTVTLHQQNVRFALGMFNAYVGLLFAPVAAPREEPRTVGVEDRDLPLDNYDDMTPEDVSKKIRDLGALEVRAVRSYERRHKNRGELLERLDRSLV